MNYINKITCKINGYLFIEIVGDFNHQLINEFKNIVDSYLRNCTKKRFSPQIIVDLALVTNLHSDSMTALINLFKKTGNGRMVIVTSKNATTNNQIFLIHLNEIFEIYYTKDEAIKSIASKEH